MCCIYIFYLFKVPFEQFPSRISACLLSHLWLLERTLMSNGINIVEINAMRGLIVYMIWCLLQNFDVNQRLLEYDAVALRYTRRYPRRKLISHIFLREKVLQIPVIFVARRIRQMGLSLLLLLCMYVRPQKTISHTELFLLH